MTKNKDPFEPWGGYASAPQEHPERYQIFVGEKVFPMSRWREAILQYLFGIWSGDKKFWNCPEIQFGTLKLTLLTKDCRVPEEGDYFFISGNAPDEPQNSYFGNYSLRVKADNRSEVMDALVRFAKDPYLGNIDIVFPQATLAFFQKERRGEYGCSVYRQR